MKKNKKKQNEKIILNHEELMPTTIGSLNTKENGPIVVLGILIFFGICIISLPYINTWISKITNPEVDIGQTNHNKENKSTDIEEPKNEEYYTISKSLNVAIDKFSVNNFEIDTTKQNITFTVTNNGGNNNYFKENNYYLELYSSDKKLLQRIKLQNDVIESSKKYTYQVSSALKNGTIALLMFKNISSIEYPNVALNSNTLICQKNNQTLTYSFNTSASNTKVLSKVEENITESNTSSTYTSDLEKYTNLSDSLANVNGVSIKLLPTSNGFSYAATIDLTKIDETNLNRYFKDMIYYKKDTEAKVISFELSSSDYECK